MSNRELDNLFKNKLEDIKKTPSSKAWQKLQSDLPEDTKKGTWYYLGIAASILLLTGFVGFMLINNEDKPDEQLAEKQILQNGEKRDVNGVDTETTIQDADIASKNIADNNRKNTAVQTSTSKNYEDNTYAKSNKPESLNTSTTNKNKALTKVNHALQDTELVAKNTKDKDLDTNEKKVSDTNATTNEVSTSIEQEEQSNGKTLIFDIEDFKKKTIAVNNESINEIGEEDPQKKSRIRKVFSAIKNIKESENGLGELRNAKNDLFALNFKKDNEGSK